MVQKVSKVGECPQAAKGMQRLEMGWKEMSLKLEAPQPGPIPGALFRAEELPLYITQMPGTSCDDRNIPPDLVEGRMWSPSF